MTIVKKIYFNDTSFRLKSINVKSPSINKRINKTRVKILDNMFMDLGFNFKLSNISKKKTVLSLNTLNNKNNWEKILPNSCNVNPLYFTSLYPWSYRMSATISNYKFAKRSVDNLLAFNINLPIKYQLAGTYFFSNYDSTNYGKLENKRLFLHRLYPSLLSFSLTQPFNFIYTPAFTNVNLAGLPYSKYGSNSKISGNPWFNDSIINTFSRRYHNISSYNIMCKETDSIISMFDNKFAFIFHPLSTTYNLQRIFTLGLSPSSKIFMPYKYLKNSQIFFKRFVLWSQKYHNFWANLQVCNVLNNNVVLHLFDLYTKQLCYNLYNVRNIDITNKLINYNSSFNKNNTIYLSILRDKNLGSLLSKNSLFNVTQQFNLSVNGFLKPFYNNRLSIDINHGRSLLGNLLFTTKKLAAITCRNLYHYYPFYSKKPYGTGIRQTLKAKSNKFNKTKLLNLNQIIKFTNMLHYTSNFFNRSQQFSKWIYSNVYTYSLFNNKSYLLDCLSLANNKFYLPRLMSNYLDGVSYKIIYQHFIPGITKWKSFFNTLQLYSYLTHYQYNIQWHKKQNKNKWYTNYKSKLYYVNQTITHEKVIVDEIVQNLNNHVQQFVSNQFRPYRSEYLHLYNQLKLLQKISGAQSNWLKYYINIQERVNIYNQWWDKAIEVWPSDHPTPDKIFNKSSLFIKALNIWLNTHFDFYENYNKLLSFSQSQLYSTSQLYNQTCINYNNNNQTLESLNFCDQNTNYGVVSSIDINCFSLLDQTIMYKSGIYRFINLKKYKQLLKYFLYLYDQALVVKPNYDIKENWEMPSVVSVWTLTLPEWEKILQQKKNLWFNNKNVLHPFQKLEKEIYLDYDHKLQLFLKTHRREQLSLQKQRVKQLKLDRIKLKQERKLEQIRIAQKLEQLKLDQIKIEEEQKLKQQQQAKRLEQLAWQQKQKDIVKVPLGQKLPAHIWDRLDSSSRTQYHIHQKRLGKEAKKLASSTSPINNNFNKS